MPSILKKLFRNRQGEDYNSGIALYNEGRYEESIAKFEAAVSAASRSSTVYRLGIFYAAEAHANIGRALLKAERYAEAGEHFGRALDENPNFPDLHYNRGVALFMDGKSDQSLPHFERALAINPEYVEARCFMAVGLHAQDQAEEARRQLQEVMRGQSEIPIQVNQFLMLHLRERETMLPEIGPVLELLESTSEFRDVYTEGITQFNLRRFDLAVDLLRRASALKPHYADIQCQLGLAQYNNGAVEEAVESFRGALAVNPRFLEAAFYLGISLYRCERYREAEEALEFARGMQNSDPIDLLFHLAQCKFQVGKNEQAERLLDAVIDRRPDFAPALYIRGLIRFSSGDQDGGIELLQSALIADPYLMRAEMDLGLMYMNQEEWTSAQGIFDRLLERRGDDSSLHCFLGQIRYAQGDMEAAREFFGKALALDPSELSALKGAAQCEIKLGRPAQAQMLLTPHLAAGGRYPDLIKLQGDASYLTGDYGGAEKEYRRALGLSADYLEAQLALVLTLRNTGRSGEAKGLLGELSRRHPDKIELRRFLHSHFVDLDELG